jgi:hypothetical protein
MLGKLVAVALILSCLWNAAGAQVTQFPPGAAVLDPDIVWDVANPHSFSISRDGKQIAYISKGALWVCRVDAGPPSKLADLPNTITAILAEPTNQKQREESSVSPHNIRHRAFYGPVYLDKHYVFSLTWTPNQDGVVYTVRKRVRENSMVAAYHVMHAPLTGAAKEIAVIEGKFGVPREYQTSFHVMSDRKYVIASAYVPLIWDVLAARPRVTPYDRLLPSSASGRLLGIEIDTRQLVLVDEQFHIVRRFEFAFLAEHAVDLTWSEDERFAVCRTRDSPPSYDANAFRIDLETGRQTPLGKCNIHDQFAFVGEGGKLLHLRVAAVNVRRYFDGELGTRVTARDHDGINRDIFKTKRIRRPEKGQRGTTFPPIIAAPDGSHVAVAVPRPENQMPGAHYHMVDRAGHAKPFVPVSDTSYITPYYPIAFAEGGRRLIARSGSTLFSLPVSAVTENDEANDD